MFSSQNEAHAVLFTVFCAPGSGSLATHVFLLLFSGGRSFRDNATANISAVLYEICLKKCLSSVVRPSIYGRERKISLKRESN